MRWHVVLAAVLGAGLPGCVSHGVDVVPFLAPTATTTLGDLVARVNAWEEVQSLVVRVDLQFETVEETEKGKGRQYRTANGRLLLSRPSSIRLNIQAPVLSVEIAEMASDGERFQLLIHPRSTGRSSWARTRPRTDESEVEADRARKSGTSPEHPSPALHRAFLPALIDAGTWAFLHEEQVTEHDLRPGAKKNAEVRKSYYVLTAIREGAGSPHAQFWFDRIGSIALVRQRVFDARGYLVTDIRYDGFLPPENAGGHSLPARVRIERPYDDYALVVTVRPDGIIVNRDLPETAFALEVPPEWGESVRRIDLDERVRN
jgi:hypothetical protein